MGLVWEVYGNVVDRVMQPLYLIRVLEIGLLAGILAAVLGGVGNLATTLFRAQAAAFNQFLFLAAGLAAVFLAAYLFGLVICLARQYLEESDLTFDWPLAQAGRGFYGAVKLFFVTAVGLMLVYYVSAFMASGSMDAATAKVLGANLFTLPASFLATTAPFLHLWVVLLFLLPFSLVLYQMPFFQEAGAIASVGGALELGLKNYFNNFKFFVLHLVVLLSVNVIVQQLLAVANVFAYYLAAPAGAAPQTAFVANLLSSLVWAGYAWFLLALNGLFFAQLYLFNIRRASGLWPT